MKKIAFTLSVGDRLARGAAAGRRARGTGRVERRRPRGRPASPAPRSCGRRRGAPRRSGSRGRPPAPAPSAGGSGARLGTRAGTRAPRSATSSPISGSSAATTAGATSGSKSSGCGGAAGASSTISSRMSSPSMRRDLLLRPRPERRARFRRRRRAPGARGSGAASSAKGSGSGSGAASSATGSGSGSGAASSASSSALRLAEAASSARRLGVRPRAASRQGLRLRLGPGGTSSAQHGRRRGRLAREVRLRVIELGGRSRLAERRAPAAASSPCGAAKRSASRGGASNAWDCGVGETSYSAAPPQARARAARSPKVPAHRAAPTRGRPHRRLRRTSRRTRAGSRLSSVAWGLPARVELGGWPRALEPAPMSRAAA